MRPSSSPSDSPAAVGLFDGVLARGPVAGIVADPSWLQALLDVEAALARAGARAGLVPSASADAIAAACRAERFDVAQLGADATSSGNPVVPLVRALTATVPQDAKAFVHVGATSQDVLDTAAMLVAKRAATVLLNEVGSAADAAAGLAATHRDTLMAGRTLLQQALPVTFGLKAAGWLTALDEVAQRLDEVARHRLAVQLGGAAGSLASLEDRGVEVLTSFAAELDLSAPVLAWHTDRTRVLELAAALGGLAAVIGKIAGDVALLAQTEIAEVAEGGPQGRGGSSTLPHKRNPVAAVSARACAAQAPGSVAALLTAAQHQEHERAAGSWHAEWQPLRDLLRSTGSAAAWLRDCLEHLEVDADRMRANLDITGELLMAERVTGALSGTLGRQVAHDLVSQAAATATCAARSFADALLDIPEVRTRLDPPAIAELLDPAGYLGSSQAFVDRALRAHVQWRSP